MNKKVYISLTTVVIVLIIGLVLYNFKGQDGIGELDGDYVFKGNDTIGPVKLAFEKDNEVKSYTISVLNLEEDFALYEINQSTMNDVVVKEDGVVKLGLIEDVLGVEGSLKKEGKNLVFGENGEYVFKPESQDAWENIKSEYEKERDEYNDTILKGDGDHKELSDKLKGKTERLKEVSFQIYSNVRDIVTTSEGVESRMPLYKELIQDYFNNAEDTCTSEKDCYILDEEKVVYMDGVDDVFTLIQDTDKMLEDAEKDVAEYFKVINEKHYYSTEMIYKEEFVELRNDFEEAKGEYILLDEQVEILTKDFVDRAF